MICGTSAFAQNNNIAISQTKIDHEITLREEALGRPLTDEEIDVMVKNIVYDELLLNEAIKLNLHLNDNEVRRRLISIMEFAYDPIVSEPDEASLRAFYEQNKVDFYGPSRVDFDHLFFENKTKLTPNELENLKDWKALGDNHWIQKKLSDKTTSEVMMFLGVEIAESMKTTTVNKWYGPLKSSIGYHFIRVTKRIAGVPRSYDELQGRVLEVWRLNQKKLLFENEMNNLLSTYKVTLPKKY